MHLYKTIKKFLFDQDYFINFFSNCVHIFGIEEILVLEETIVKIKMRDFTVEISGNDIRILKLTKKEILLQGIFKEMRLL